MDGATTTDDAQPGRPDQHSDAPEPNPWDAVEIWATKQVITCTKKWAADQWKGNSIPSSAYAELSANSAIKAELSPIAIFHHTPSKIFVSTHECGQPQLVLAGTTQPDFERVEEMLKNSTIGTAAIAPVYIIYNLAKLLSCPL